MKNLSVFVLLLLFFQILNAQEETKRNPFVFGSAVNFSIRNNTAYIPSFTTSLGFYGSSDTGFKQTNFAFLPYFGKEVNKHLLLGIELNFRTGKHTRDTSFSFGQGFEIVAKQIGGGVFVRYLLNPESKVKFYLQPYIAYSIANDENIEYVENNTAYGFAIIPTVIETKIRLIEFGMKTGLLYNINDKLRAVLRIGGLEYRNGNVTAPSWSDEEKKYSSLETNFNMTSVFLGVEMKF